MESYHVELKNTIFKIIPQDDITYLVQSDGMNDFVLCPATNENSTTWKVTKGMALAGFVTALGLAIEDKERSNTIND